MGETLFDSFFENKHIPKRMDSALDVKTFTELKLAEPRLNVPKFQNVDYINRRRFLKQLKNPPIRWTK